MGGNATRGAFCIGAMKYSQGLASDIENRFLLDRQVNARLYRHPSEHSKAADPERHLGLV